MARPKKTEDNHGGFGDAVEAETPVTPEPKKEKPAGPPMSASARFMASDTVKALQKKLGDASVTTGASFKDQTLKLDTGIFQLNYHLGGGWPIGRIMHVYGKKSSSKTTTILRAFAAAQRSCATCWHLFDEIPPVGSPVTICPCGNYREPVCGFLDAEAAMDFKWATTLGVDVSRLVYSRPLFAEEGIDVADGWLRSGEMDIIAIDSIAYMVPLKEQEKDAASFIVGTHAMLINKLVRKLVSGSVAVQRESGRYPTLFMLNQIREKVGVMFGSPETTTGGHSPGYAASVEVKFSQGKVQMDDKTGLPLWADISYKLDKNKTLATQRAEGEYKLLFGNMGAKKKGSVLDEPYVAEQAQEVGLITGAGAYWSCGGVTFPSKSAIVQRMREDAAFDKKLRADTLKILLSTLT